MNVSLLCPGCGQPVHLNVDQAATCVCACGHGIDVRAAIPSLPQCVVCGNHEIYKKKDFPHWLGMTILIVALILSTVTYYWYEKWWSWSFLIGSAIVDGVMYLLVEDVLVCYRCEAHYRGFTPTASHEPFEISIGERYRQENIRRDQLKRSSAGQDTH